MAISWEKDVFSSMVQRVAYDADKEEMYVTWTHNKKHPRSIYSNVPEKVATDLANAPSVGQMIQSDIINHYPHRYG